MKSIDLVAPCGLYCRDCVLYKDNISDDLKDAMSNKYEVPLDEVPCRGCRVENGNHFHLTAGHCATLDCAGEKGVTYCFECGDFPCELLAPLADGAGTYPHNLKVYNLCRMQKLGVEKWVDEEATKTKRAYMHKRFKVGKGLAD